jgi:hypothetical protein
MPTLDRITDKIQVILGGVPATEADCIATWVDIDASVSPAVYKRGRIVIPTIGTTPVDIVDVPPNATTQRKIETISIFNRDSAPIQVGVWFNDNGTNRVWWQGTIGAGEQLTYSEAASWNVKPRNTSFDLFNTVILGANVTNNNAVANTIQDVTGLSFPVVTGQMYWFEFEILYTAAATTTGSRWSINGPAAPTRLCYTSEYSLTATTTTRNANNISYDLPAASNASSGATGSNMARINGIIQPISNGVVIARFASEVASSAIVALAGSRVVWQRVL